MQKHVNLVDLVKSFPTNIFLQIWRRYRRERALYSLIIWLKNQSKVRYRIVQLRYEVVPPPPVWQGRQTSPFEVVPSPTGARLAGLPWQGRPTNPFEFSPSPVGSPTAGPPAGWVVVGGWRLHPQR